MTGGRFLKANRRDLIMVAVFLLLAVLLWQLRLFKGPTGQPGVKAVALVTSVDNRSVEGQGFITVGHQEVRLNILDGPYAGRELAAQNLLRGRTDLDKIFVKGDRAVAAISTDADGNIIQVIARDHYRIGKELWLFALFALLLLGFSGWTGIKALLSFVLTCLVIWKLVVPLCLLGWSPILVSLGAVMILCWIIIFSVAGLNDKGLTAFLGAFLGIVSSCVLGIWFSHGFRIDGAVMPYSQALFYAGFEYLNLTDLFIGGIYLASSGALMDLAMDVAAGMKEVVMQRPDIPRRELLKSGFRIGRMVVGTMTTTLLLAYSGGYLTLIMTFVAEGVGPLDFMNYPYVAAEIARTLVGSIGLVLVAPFTALVGMLVLRAGPGDTVQPGKDSPEASDAV